MKKIIILIVLVTFCLKMDFCFSQCDKMPPTTTTTTSTSNTSSEQIALTFIPYLLESSGDVPGTAYGPNPFLMNTATAEDSFISFVSPPQRVNVMVTSSDANFSGQNIAVFGAITGFLVGGGAAGYSTSVLWNSQEVQDSIDHMDAKCCHPAKVYISSSDKTATTQFNVQ